MIWMARDLNPSMSCSALNQQCFYFSISSSIFPHPFGDTSDSTTEVLPYQLSHAQNKAAASSAPVPFADGHF